MMGAGPPPAQGKRLLSTQAALEECGTPRAQQGRVCVEPARTGVGRWGGCHPSPLPPGACGSQGATTIRGLQTPAFRAPGTPRASELCQEKVAVEDQGKDMDGPPSSPTWILTHAPVSKETGTVPHPEGPSLQPAGCAPTASLGAECLQRWPALQATPSLGQPAARPQQDGVRSVERVMDTFQSACSGASEAFGEGNGQGRKLPGLGSDLQPW